jgi:GSH-dependent disulfide-bond oxidoreductase
MIDLYGWPTPNLYKVTILFEETGTQYNTIPVNIGTGEQFNPDFLKISPNNKMPAIVDHEGPDGKPISIFESGAILMYIAEKTGQFLPRDMRGRYTVIEWLMFQMGGIGPMLGQAHHFRMYAPEKIQYAIDRYTNETKRLYNVVDRRLADRPYLAGDYSIADMAVYPWLRGHENQGQKLEDFPNLKRWYDSIAARPAVKRGLEVLADKRRRGPMDEKQKEVLFGAQQYAKR